MKKLIFSFLVLVLLTSLGSSSWAFNVCEAQFRFTFLEQVSFKDQVIEKIPILKRLPIINSRNWSDDLRYDHDLYRELKSEIKSGSVELASFSGQRLPVELLLAIFDVALEIENVTNESLERMISEASEENLQTLSFQFTSIFESEGLSKSKIRRLAETLLIFNNPNYRENWWIFKKWKSFQTKLKKKIEVQTAQSSVIEFLNRAHLFDSQSKKERAIEVYQEHLAKINWTLAGSATGLIWYATGFFIPIAIPGFNLFDGFKMENYVEPIPKDQISRLKRKWLVDSIWHQAQNIISGFYMLSLVAVLAYIGNDRIQDFVNPILSQDEIVEQINSRDLDLESEKQRRLASLISACEANPEFSGVCPIDLVEKYKDLVQSQTEADFRIGE